MENKLLQGMLDWHERMLKEKRFNIPLDHEQSEYLKWLASDIKNNPSQYIDCCVWVDVKDRFPDFDDSYLCFIEAKQECGTILKYHGARNNIINQWSVLDREVITHWMPLPEPPSNNK